MADAGAVLTTAFAALALVYQAYTTVKTNRERCAHLVQRCQAVVDRLEAIMVVHGDAAVRSRLGDLEQAFRKTAKTIRDVGQQGAIRSLLNSDDNALKLEDCQHALSELVTLLSLEHVVDMSAWQQENESARRRDHNELVEMGHQLKRGNFVIMNELSQHGATIAELYDAVNHLSLKLVDQDTASKKVTESRQRSSSFSTVRQPSRSYEDDSAGSNRPRRLSMPTSPHVLVDSLAWTSSQEDSIEPSGQPDSQWSGQNLVYSKALPPTPPPSYRSNSYCSVSTHVYNENEAATHAVSTPREQVVAGAAFDEAAIAETSVPNFSRSAVETIYEAPTTAKERLLVELRAAPTLTSFNSAVPLKNFIPLAAEHVKLAQENASAISEALRPLLRQIREGSNFDSVIVLCPRGGKPSVITVGKKRSKQVNLVKGYILDTEEMVTLVSVRYKRRSSFVLIPFAKDMSVGQAKLFIIANFGKIMVQSCHIVEQSIPLQDGDTFEGSGVKPFRHSLTMTIVRSPERTSQ